MKNITTPVFYVKRLLVALLALLLAACGGDDNPKPSPNPAPDTVAFTVTFHLNAADAQPQPLPQKVKEGDRVVRPQSPIRSGYLFAGWFIDIDNADTEAFNFDTPIKAHTDLYARWETRPEKFWIPDENFRNKLKSELSSAFDDQDSLLTQSDEVMQQTGLEISSLRIADLTGIAYFSALTALDCSDNELTSLDVSQNTALATLECFDNKLTTLDVNTALTKLSCYNNLLTALNVSQNAALADLNCYNNLLTALDVSQNANLKLLNVRANQLTSLNISQNASLTGLDAHANRLTSLDVSQNAALTILYCHNNPLTTLDVSRNTALTELNCSDNELKALDVSQNTSLVELSCQNNQLQELKVSQHTDLKALNCSDNELKALDVSQNTSLVKLSCQNNQLADLNLRGMRAADALVINASSSDANPLTSLKVHENLKDHAEIKEVKTNRGAEVIIETYSAEAGSTDYTPVCDDYDPLAEICNATANEFTIAFQLNGGGPDIPDQTVEAGKTAQQPPNPTRDGYTFEGWFTDKAYQNAFNFSDPITASVTLYAKWELERVDGRFFIPDDNFRNKLKSLIPAAFDAQDRLIIGHDQVTTRTALDVRSSSIADLTGIEYFTALMSLGCANNKLTSLDVSRNTSLTDLYCSANQLTSLDVLRNTALGVLFCDSNQLKELNVSQNAGLTLFRCHDNQLTELDMSGMRRVDSDALQIDATASGSNPLNKLLVHENLQDHGEIKRAKTNRGDALVIETYSAEAGSTDYTRVCADYDPLAEICNSTATDFTLSFQLNGGGPDIPDQTVEAGKTAQEPQDPTQQGYTFEGWFSDDNTFQNKFDFMGVITSDTTLYAKWELEAKPGRFFIPDANFRDKLKSLIPDAFDDQERLITGHDQVTQRTKLEVFVSGIANLTGIEYFTALTSLNCSDNQLTSLDVSQNTSLQSLQCYSNELKDLNVSQNTALTSLECGDNQLTSLDVSRNTALTSLDCNGNQLTSLDVSRNTALSLLYCIGNQLTSLDVSQNTALTQLWCLNNGLTELNMRGMRSTPFASALRIDASSTSNPLNKLLVHENLQDDAEIKEVKTNRGAEVIIETYSAAAASTDYTAVCLDYDPNDGDAGSCKKAAP